MDVTTEIILYVAVAVLIHIGVLYFVSITRKPKRSVSGRHVVVTGGSSGIGLFAAIACAKRGASVTIIARNVQLLEKALTIIEQHRQNESQRFAYKSIDLSKSYEEVASGLAEIEHDSDPIYMLINCAGMAICGVYEEISVADAKLLMDINYWTAYNCSRYVLPKMKEARSGIIVITGSQASLFGIYGYGPYAAAKFALRGMAETIVMESRHLGVSVTLALPADTNTPGFENESKSKPEETKIISGSGGLAKAEDVAEKIIKDALNEQFFSIMGLESWLITLVCSGMAPWGGFTFNLFQGYLLGPLRVVVVILQWHFSRIIKNCAKDKETQEKAKQKTS